MTSKNTMDARIGVDVGGTFTDFVLSRGDGSPLIYHKEASTSGAPARAVISGFHNVVEYAGLSPKQVSVVAHGTTIGLNAILQRKGARTGLVVSKGSRDILELGRLKIGEPLNMFSRPDAPLVPRTQVVETHIRLDGKGHGDPLTDAEVERVAASLQALGLEAYAIALTNAYLQPEIEIDFAERLSRALGADVSASCRIWPEIREYERAMVAVLNASVTPLMHSYLDEIESGLHGRGFDGRLLITTSNGGTVPIDAARRRPVDTLLSGPATGVVAAVNIASNSGKGNLITVDMGGTSSDMAVVSDASIEYSNRAHIGEFPLFVPVVNVSAIGAGGGSIVRVDKHGVLKVGPESAGADPGPIAYGRGGTLPTLTDCYLVCGYLAQDQVLGGTVGLSYTAARNALGEIAQQLKFTGDDAPERAAWSAIRVATAKMATELRKGLAERGIDPVGYTLMPFGGAGPVLGALLATEARITQIVVPEAAGTFCALGAMLSDLKRDFSRTIRDQFGRNLARAVRDALQELRTQADEWLAHAEELIKSREYVAIGAMRYVGQSYELQVILDESVIAGSDQGFIQAFHDEHEKRYGFIDHDSNVVLTAVQLTAIGRLEHKACETPVNTGGQDGTVATRRIFVEGDWHEANVICRSELRAGQAIPIPAVITQKDTTVLIPPGWQAALTSDGTIQMRKN